MHTFFNDEIFPESEDTVGSNLNFYGTTCHLKKYWELFAPIWWYDIHLLGT